VLVIRLQRTGRKKQATYRMVVAEHSWAVQGKHIDVVGFYNPSENKLVKYDEAKIKDWVSKGAQVSDSLAALLKTNGMDGMDKFLSPRDKKRAKKNPGEEPEVAEEPAKEEAPAVVEETKEKTPAPEAAAEESVATE